MESRSRAPGRGEICTRPNYGVKCDFIRSGDDDLHGWSDVIVPCVPPGRLAGATSPRFAEDPTSSSLAAGVLHPHNVFWNFVPFGLQSWTACAGDRARRCGAAVGFHGIDISGPRQDSWIVSADSPPTLQVRRRVMSTNTLIILIVVLVLLFGGGGGYYWSRGRR